mgnify:CR=1 FL=1
MQTNLDSYQNLLHQPHFHAPNRAYLSNEKRAAQFMPFKSLSTYENTIQATMQSLEIQDIWEDIDYTDN